MSKHLTAWSLRRKAIPKGNSSSLIFFKARAILVSGRVFLLIEPLNMDNNRNPIIFTKSKHQPIKISMYKRCTVTTWLDFYGPKKQRPIQRHFFHNGNWAFIFGKKPSIQGGHNCYYSPEKLAWRWLEKPKQWMSRCISYAKKWWVAS